MKGHADEELDSGVALDRSRQAAQTERRISPDEIVSDYRIRTDTGIESSP